MVEIVAGVFVVVAFLVFGCMACVDLIKHVDSWYKDDDDQVRPL